MLGLILGHMRALLEANQFIQIIAQARVKDLMSRRDRCQKKWITESQFEYLAIPMIKNGYGRYLMQVLKES